VNKIAAAIARGFKGLLRFSGRSSRTDFWSFAIFVFLIVFGIWMSVMSVEMSRALGEAHQYAGQHPEDVTITTSATQYSIKVKNPPPGMGPDFGFLMKWLAGIAVFAIAMLAASVTRRLHDTNRTGFWGLLPIPFLFSGLWLMSGVFKDVGRTAEPDMSAFFLLFANNLIYLVCIGVLGFLLLRSGTAGDNRFGDRDGQSPS
jgi:uncharacterized membrane protein YhaH (DUF805 family)